MICQIWYLTLMMTSPPFLTVTKRPTYKIRFTSNLLVGLCILLLMFTKVKRRESVCVSWSWRERERDFLELERALSMTRKESGYWHGGGKEGGGWGREESDTVKMETGMQKILERHPYFLPRASSLICSKQRCHIRLVPKVPARKLSVEQQPQ